MAWVVTTFRWDGEAHVVWPCGERRRLWITRDRRKPDIGNSS
jgi:hypothetical protein